MLNYQSELLLFQLDKRGSFIAQKQPLELFLKSDVLYIFEKSLKIFP